MKTNFFFKMHKKHLNNLGDSTGKKMSTLTRKLIPSIYFYDHISG